MDAALEDLQELSAEEIREAHSEWRLADILSATRISDTTVEAARQTLQQHEGWSTQSLTRKLQEMVPLVENRDRKTIDEWSEVLR